MWNASVVINVFIAVFSVVSWLQIALGVGDPDHLASRGWESLKYFTVLSNLFSGAICAIYAFVQLSGTQIPLWLVVLKLEATTAVMITFSTVIALLNSKFGWRSMYSGGSLWMHLILPLLATIDYLFFVPAADTPTWVLFCTLIPPMLYGLWYLRNIRIHGVEENGVVYDWYGFLRWGRRAIPVLAVCMFGATLVIAACLRMGNSLLCVQLG